MGFAGSMEGTVILACLFLVAYNAFLYPALLSIITPLCRNGTTPDFITPKVSLIVAAYNEEKDIEQKINNSLELEYPGLEIIIASDGSTDATSKICSQYKKKIKFYDREKRSGKINTLNHIVPKATGEILVFSDANTFYDKDAITQLVTHFNDSTVGCTTGYVKLIAEGRKHELGEELFTRLERSVQENESAIHSVIGLDGAMYAMRKNLYQPLSNFLIEDFVMGMSVIKQGFRVIYEPQARAVEASSENLQDEFRRKSRIVAGGFQSMWVMGFLIRKPFLLFAFVSHKFLRLISVELLLIAFVLNFFVLENPFFLLLLYLQLIFYFIAVLGIFVKPLSFVYYFVVMQAASFWGLVKYIFNIQKITWDKAKRA